MKKQLAIIGILTILFFVAVITFEVLHRMNDTTITTVNSKYLKQIDISLPTDFMEELNTRLDNPYSPDLGY